MGGQDLMITIRRGTTGKCPFVKQIDTNLDSQRNYQRAGQKVV
jgi:hypothetical protein